MEKGELKNADLSIVVSQTKRNFNDRNALLTAFILANLAELRVRFRIRLSLSYNFSTKVNGSRQRLSLDLD